MASIRREVIVTARPDDVWSAVRDVGAIHTRLAPGFVVATRMDGDARIVTFGNGMEVRELIVDVDDQARRLVWSAVGGRLSHHNASMQVADEGGGRTRLVWIADLLPNELASYVAGLMEQGLSAAKKTLEAAEAPVRS
jgi:carbon monoxide dehydrogenase subunit G